MGREELVRMRSTFYDQLSADIILYYTERFLLD